MEPAGPASDRELPPTRLVAASDLYRVPCWAVAKIFVAVVPIPVLFGLARSWGIVVAHVHRERRRRALAELGRTFGDTAGDAYVRLLARRHFQFLVAQRLTRIWPRLRGFEGAEACPVEGLEHLDAALAAGRGAVLLTAHVGYGRLIRHLLRARGYPVYTVGYAGQGYRVPARFTRFGRYARVSLLRLPYIERRGVGDCDFEAGVNLRPLVAALGRNEVLLTTGEGLGAVSMLPAQVLGRTIRFSPGIFSLAKGTGAAVLPAFAVDSEAPRGIGISLRLFEPIPLGGGVSTQEAVEEFARVLERVVRASPHQWGWSFRYFEEHARDQTGDRPWRAAAREAFRTAR